MGDALGDRLPWPTGRAQGSIPVRGRAGAILSRGVPRAGGLHPRPDRPPTSSVGAARVSRRALSLDTGRTRSGAIPGILAPNTSFQASGPIKLDFHAKNGPQSDAGASCPL